MHKKVKYTLIIIFSLLFCTFVSQSCFALTQQEVGNAIAQFSINFANNYGADAEAHGKENQTVYSTVNPQRAAAYNKQKTSGVTSEGESYTNKYAMDCVGWIAFALKYSIGYIQDTMTNGGTAFCITPWGYGAEVGPSGQSTFERIPSGSTVMPRRYRFG